jgi:hypothetical protein
MELGDQQPRQALDTGQYRSFTSGSSDQQSNLCYACQSIFSGNPKTLEFGASAEDILPQTVHDLQQSALQGCQLCYLRWGQLSDEEGAKVTVGCEMIKYGFSDSRIGQAIVFEYVCPSGKQEFGIKNSIGLKAVKGRLDCILLLQSSLNIDLG